MIHTICGYSCGGCSRPVCILEITRAAAGRGTPPWGTLEAPGPPPPVPAAQSWRDSVVWVLRSFQRLLLQQIAINQ